MIAIRALATHHPRLAKKPRAKLSNKYILYVPPGMFGSQHKAVSPTPGLEYQASTTLLLFAYIVMKLLLESA